ncbi:putative holin-like toxin [Lentilactobacillus farraginis]|nr:putative holin-like toxin [Lentilactobacillus farraginis]
MSEIGSVELDGHTLSLMLLFGTFLIALLSYINSQK